MVVTKPALMAGHYPVQPHRMKLPNQEVALHVLPAVTALQMVGLLPAVLQGAGYPEGPQQHPREGLRVDDLQKDS